MTLASIKIREFADEVEIDRSERAKRRSTYRGTEGVVVLYAAPLVPGAGADTLLEAFIRLSGEFTGVMLHILGDGPERTVLEVRAGTIPRGKIHFHGEVEESLLPRFFASADIFVLPSRSEIGGVRLAQAMASRLAVICSSDVGVENDLIAAERTALVVPVGDSGALASALRRLIQDKELRAGLSNAGYLRVMESAPTR